MKRPTREPNPMANTIEVLLAKNAKLVEALTMIANQYASTPAAAIAFAALAENEK